MFCIEHRQQNNLFIECILTEIAHFASLPSAKIQLNRNAALKMFNHHNSSASE